MSNVRAAPTTLLIALCLSGCSVVLNRPAISTAMSPSDVTNNGSGGLPVASALLSISGATTHDFSTVATNALGADQVFTVTNTGTDTATLGTVSTAALGLSGAYSLRAGGTCTSGGTLAAGASCTLIVTIATKTSGSASDTIELSYADSAASKAATRGLTGAGAGTVPSAAFVGATSSYQWKYTTAGGLLAGSNATHGAMFGNQTVFVDSNLFMYVGEDYNGGSRIHKYDTVSGAYRGWIGIVSVTPTGDAPGGGSGCASTPRGSVTPGWCFGGSGTYYSGGAWTGLYGDGTYIYATDYWSTVVFRWNASTGADAGWIGLVGVTPTGTGAGNPSNCTATSPGSITPGWCLGGSSALGSAVADGGLRYPQGLTGDGTYLYVISSTNIHRLQRYVMSTGAYAGWIGMVGTANPTGDAAGYSGGDCSSTSNNSVTPGWCLGGRSKQGTATGNGGFSDATSVYADATVGAIFVGDRAYGRVQRYNLATGTFEGWIGSMGTTLPTGNGVGTHASCTSGQSSSTGTPGWCIGGTSTSGEDDNEFFGSLSLHGDGTYLYVSEYAFQRARISRVSLADGTPQGWIGAVLQGNSPTGGDTGCNGVTTITPGWCTGGRASYGGTGDIFAGVAGLNVHNSTLYVNDIARGGVEIFDLTQSGAAGFRLGWSGGLSTQTSGWESSSDLPSQSDGRDGGFYNSYGTYTDGTYFYVAETNGAKIRKYNVSTGALVGWIGTVDLTPSGGASGCATASSGDFTPGWCMGGRAVISLSQPGFRDPYGVSGDDTYIYVSQYYSILRYIASTGAPAGWIGVIGTQPTGGASGCTDSTGHPPSTVTPGWCTGGDMDRTVTSPAPANGSISNARAIKAHGNYLYVVQSDSHRIDRFDRVSGAFAGWIGGVGASSPTGDAAGSPGGCSGAASGQATPGWCMGGISSSGTYDGALDTPLSLAIDDSYLYVVESTPSVYRYDLVTGAFRGWLGQTGATPPTGGNGGCVGASAGTASPGWCYGGTKGVGGQGDGIFSDATGVVVRDGYLYVMDRSNDRILKYRVSTPVPTYIGWRGKVGDISGLGGDAGCSSATLFSATPGWCTGGLAMQGIGQGQFFWPRDGAADSLYLYVLDDAVSGRFIRVPR